MSTKRHKHNTLSKFKGNVPKTRQEFEFDGKTDLNIPIRKVDHRIGDSWYNPTKGWRKIREYVPHTVLNKLLTKIGLLPVNA
jgi:hypothetical protein